jgi:PAS domain S-box-containing protein
MEEQLRTSQMLFRAILDNSPNMIFLKNREGRYLLVNRRFENVFHLNQATILGKADDEIFPESQAAIYQAIE